MASGDLQLGEREKQTITAASRRLFSSQAYQSLDKALGSIFPQPSEQAKTERARRILGEVASNLTDHELVISLAKLQYLVEYSMDIFERESYDGMTLKELLTKGER